MQGWVSILIMIALGAGFALISVVLSGLLGPRNPSPEKSAPYECGMPPFLYPWAMALRDLGWSGFLQVVLFMTLLLFGYIYVWRKGALDWGSENV